MKTVNVIGAAGVATIIVLAGIGIVGAAPSLLVQSASATNVTTATASVGGGEQEAVSSTTTTNNASNALLGRLFSYDEGKM